MDHVIRAFPLLAGKRQDFDRFTQELRERSADATKFFTTHGIVRETWHLQENPTGDLVICCTDIDNASEGGARSHTKPLGPECLTVFEWPSA